MCDDDWKSATLPRSLQMMFGFGEIKVRNAWKDDRIIHCQHPGMIVLIDGIVNVFQMFLCFFFKFELEIQVSGHDANVGKRRICMGCPCRYMSGNCG